MLYKSFQLPTEFPGHLAITNSTVFTKSLWCRYADELLKNLWRWLCSPSSALASPILQKTVASLMRKCLAQLVADLKTLGATVVSADSSVIILATGKQTMSAAVGSVTSSPSISSFILFWFSNGNNKLCNGMLSHANKG